MAKKAIVIGLDAAMPNLVMKFVEEGALPNMERLIRDGTYAEEALAPLPGLTHPNWVSIATGAWPSTHGVTCHTVHKRGEPLDKVHAAYTSDSCRAEFLWEAAERVGKRSIIMKYLCSWPPRVKDSVQVAGHGYAASETGPVIVPAETFVLHARKIGPKSGWSDLPKSGETYLETDFTITPKMGEPIKFYVLVLNSIGKGYDSTTLGMDKDFKNRFVEVPIGKWSEWKRLHFKKKNQVDEATVRFKLLSLSPDGKTVILFHTEVHPIRGFTFPDSLGPELVEKIGPYYDLLTTARGTDEATAEEVVRYQAEWLAGATRYLMSRYRWDLFFMQWWLPDHTGHRYLHMVEPSSPLYRKEVENSYWDLIRRDYQITDKLIGDIVENADKDTLIVLVSDHGMFCSKVVFLNNVLAEAGLLTLKKDLKKDMLVVDWSKTKAFHQRCIHIYINVKGRDPSGIVEPGREYEQVRQEVIEALYKAKDPESGERMVALALRKEEAGFLGCYGDHVGDVICAMAQGYNTHFAFREGEVYGRLGPKGDWRQTKNVIQSYGSGHGSLLPGISKGFSIEKAFLVMSGPGFKRGYTLSKPVWIIDVAPTISHLLNMPRPRNADGQIIWDALE